MMVDSSTEMDIRRRMAIEMQARENHKLAAMEETRARAAALAASTSHHSTAPLVTPPRQRLEQTYKEAEYDAAITQYMVEMDVSQLCLFNQRNNPC